MRVTEFAVHVPTLVPWPASLVHAAHLAAYWSAGLVGVHVLPPLDSLSLADDPQTLAALSREQHRRRHEAIDAAAAFAAFASRAGVTRSRWCVAEGAVPESLAWAASGAEFLVLAAPDEDEAGRLEIDRAVIDARLPCLVLPRASATRSPPYARIALAWNGSVEAWRALVSALPFLLAAQSVVLIDGCDPAVQREVMLWDPPDVLSWLQRHGIRASRVPIDPESDAVGAELLSQADAQRADLIVMGAYGRSRFAEWLLGGVTRHMLRQCTLPMLMHH